MLGRFSVEGREILPCEALVFLAWLVQEHALPVVALLVSKVRRAVLGSAILRSVG